MSKAGLDDDERVTPIIKDVWAQLPAPARIMEAKCEVKQVFRAQVLLVLDLLERETVERVYGSLAVVLRNCAEQATSWEYSISNASCRSGKHRMNQSTSDDSSPLGVLFGI